MKDHSRRRFIKRMGGAIAGASLAPLVNPFKSGVRAAAQPFHVYISRNGTPVTNMHKVLELAGGIESYVDRNDVVVLKPNLLWRNQGYTHTQATKTLIEIILNRPGGFDGEIIVADGCASYTATYNAWNASEDNRQNNWPDMNYRELIADFQTKGHANVTGVPIPGRPMVSGPAEGIGFKVAYTTIQNCPALGDYPDANGRRTRLGAPIFESPYSGNLIDSQSGVWDPGRKTYTGQQVKLIFLPTLNVHSNYAGITSAVKCHIGFMPVSGGTDENGQFYGVHGSPESNSVGFRQNDPTNRAAASGEAIGAQITEVINPTLYITVGEYLGHYGRTDSNAAHTKVIGLCTDPVTLDYWMGRNVTANCPCGRNCAARKYDPGAENVFRDQLRGCHSRGVGTMNEAEIVAHQFDFDVPELPNKPTGLRIVETSG